MTYPLTISESEKQHILGSYGLSPLVKKNYIKEILSECRFTMDGKYVEYRGKLYSSETGDIVPLTEKWTLSDTLHTMGDLVSAGMDFVIPGSGAVVDTINAISYVIEAQFKSDPAEKMMLYVLGAITFAFVIIPGPLQAAAIPLKTFVKTGKGAANPLVRTGIKIVEKNINRILTSIPNLLERVFRTKLGRIFLGKTGSRKIAFALRKFSNRARVAIAKVFKTKTDDEIKILTDKAVKYEKEYNNALKRFGYDYKKADDYMKGQKWNKAGRSIGRSVAKTLSKLERKKLATFFKSPISHIQGQLVIKKLGIVPGKSYGYMTRGGKSMKVTVIKGLKDGVLVKFPNGTQTWVNSTQFLEGVIGNPFWTKVYKFENVAVPVFIKRLSELILPDGRIDMSAVSKLPDLNPSETSKESLEWLRADMTTEPNVTPATTTTNQSQSNVDQLFREGLTALGYTGDLKQAVKQFQIDNQLEDTDGTMNRVTAKELAIELRKKKINKDLELKLYNL